MKSEKMELILAQLAIGTLNSIGWISDGSASKAYEGVLLDVTSGKRGLRLTVRVCRLTGRTVTVTWRMSQSDADLIVQAYDRMRIDHMYGMREGQVLTVVQPSVVGCYPGTVYYMATVYGYACELCAV